MTNYCYKETCYLYPYSALKVVFPVDVFVKIFQLHLPIQQNI